MEAPAATDPEADGGLGVVVGLVPLATPAWASEILLLAELSEDPEVEAVSPSKIVLMLPEGNWGVCSVIMMSFFGARWARSVQIEGLSKKSAYSSMIRSITVRMTRDSCTISNILSFASILCRVAEEMEEFISSSSILA